MSRVVFIGGFSNGQRSVENVSEALLDYYDDVDPFTFPQAMANPEEVSESVWKSSVITHSAGMLALYGSRPKELMAFGAPLPRTRTGLVLATAMKSLQMFERSRSLDDVRDATRFNVDSITELAVFTKKRGAGHLRYFVNGAISSYDAISVGREMRQGGSDVSLIYGENDLYYCPSDLQKDKAREGGVKLRELPDGLHDSLILNPVKALNQYFNGVQSLRAGLHQANRI